MKRSNSRLVKFKPSSSRTRTSLNHRLAPSHSSASFVNHHHFPLPHVTRSINTIATRRALPTASTTPTPQRNPQASYHQSAPNFAPSQNNNMASAASFYDFKPLDKRGNEVSMADYKDKVVLVVNTASKCGSTPQYAGLEKLYKDISANHPDFVIIGFPCNQFAGQEPGSDDEIQEFCQVNYGVTFPIMGKTDVNGDNAAPIFQWLKEKKPGLMGLKRVKWNFEKFLVGRDGEVKQRWATTTTPDKLEKTILEELEKKA